jgi:medium-chain acyl-[acyl-carrier-protein] hydrolase
MSMPANPWFPWSIDAAETAVRLFCFPHAGGGASTFREWQRLLLPDIVVSPVQLPGHEARFTEPPFRRMSELIDALTTAIRPYLGQPFAFFGHSLGGLVCFELTHRLHRDRLPEPRQLFLAACPGPSVRRRWLERATHRLPRDELLKELQRFAGTPSEAIQHQELMDALLPTIRADFEVVATAERAPMSPLDVPITALGGIDDEDVSPEELESWSRQTAAHFRRHLLPGGHFFLKSARSELLALLARELATLARPRSPSGSSP